MEIAKIEKLIEEIALPIVEENGYELVGVDFINEEGEWYLRVSIDNEGGISLNDCEKVSRPLSDKLDKLDPIDISYFLEVSSPGINRPLKRDIDFERFKNNKIKITFIDNFKGMEAMECILKGLNDNKVIVNLKGKIIEIEREKIKSINLNEY